MDKNAKIMFQTLISLATQYVQTLGFDEEKSIEAVNKIVDDAQKDVPETPVGKDIKEKAAKIITDQANGFASPYMATPKYDYGKLRDETSLPAISEILKKLGEHSEFLPIPTKPTEEYEKKSDQSYNQLMLDTFAILNGKGVGMKEYKYIFDSLKTIVGGLEEGIMQQVVGHRHEIMSRIFGTRNPGNERFDSNYATYKDLIDTLMKVREQTGGKKEDYFGINPDETGVE